ncbi:translation elongation factor Ts [Microscilla marina]|uniref:Elongation factor Ts n=1 Tax=Microscilla marina ATCC 23134 TaxID=313606 RepID=A1ZN21_MICM2|nr:translation elongation factor Ts [Microscilla marina]EAY28202.1 translation elongation factor Ts [Microscilla marina ATCC 23134]
MAISAQDVKKLREMTGAGMMDCKKALQEANGDFDEAVTILRKKGQKISSKRADRETTEGVVFINETEDGKQATLVALNCETDFVAKNEDFVNLGQAVLKVATDNAPADLAALKGLSIDGRSIEEHLTDLMGKIGEKIEVSAYEQLKADKVVSYIHSNAKIGVLVALNGDSSDEVAGVGRDIAMQIAAMKPVSVDETGVPEEVKQREMEIGKEQARKEGKPDNILEKIAMGKLNKFYKENTLLHQQFVKDSSKTIKQVLADVNKDLKVDTFKLVSIG